MRRPAPDRRPRSGTTLPETALVLSGFLLFLMGVFEYSRFLMLLHIGNNAARSGARYACVNVSKPSNFDTVDYNGQTNIAQTVKNEMGGAHNLIDSFAISVFPCDNAQLYADPPVIASKSGSPAWLQATFTERIAVKITGNYKPILPGFVFFYTGGANTVPITIAASSCSEG